jgi:quinol monooxygenase YgiN|tara:strand:- start:2189 stop:2497 length:309 start_codon:yes stop_codon:yes gene_type:complete
MAFTVTAILKVKKRYLAEYKRRIKRHAKNSVTREPGCISFEVNVDESDPHRFLLYELYVDKAAFEAHTEMPFMKKHLRETAIMLDGDLELIKFWSRSTAPAK